MVRFSSASVSFPSARTVRFLSLFAVVVLFFSSPRQTQAGWITTGGSDPENGTSQMFLEFSCYWSSPEPVLARWSSPSQNPGDPLAGFLGGCTIRGELPSPRSFRSGDESDVPVEPSWTAKELLDRPGGLPLPLASALVFALGFGSSIFRPPRASGYSLLVPDRPSPGAEGNRAVGV